MVISTNIPALNSSLSMRRADRGLQQAMNRLASGFRINSAKEDAAGLSIANQLTYQVGGLQRASENATHGTSLIQTAEGALHEVHNMLQRMRELAVQSANDTLSNNNRTQIHMEIEQLVDEIHQISRRTEFNRMRILNGEADRVIENRDQANIGVITRSVVTVNYVSQNTVPGQLSYTISEVGRHAVLPIDMDTTQPLPAGSISLNGIEIKVGPGMSWSDFQDEFLQTLEYAGIELVPMITGGAVVGHSLVSVIAGSSQHITFDGSPAILDLVLGPAAARHDRGSDAVLDSFSMVDLNGNPIDTLSWAQSAEGNQVVLRGNRGEEIRLNLQVNFSNDPAHATGFVFADNADAPTDAGGAARDMRMDVRNFGPLMIQIGPGHNMAMPVQIPRVNAETLGLAEFVGGRKRLMVNYRNRDSSTAAIDIADDALNRVSTIRSRLGAMQNRLESTIRNLDIAAENAETSRSRIQDTDIARESTRFATYNVMMQAAQAILAQANQRPQMLVSLLQ